MMAEELLRPSEVKVLTDVATPDEAGARPEARRHPLPPERQAHTRELFLHPRMARGTNRHLSPEASISLS